MIDNVNYLNRHINILKGIDMSKFYVYMYIRNKDSATGAIGTPYYVGKGCGDRAYVKHYAPVPADPANIVFVKQNLSEQKAFDLEIELIAKYGRKDLNTGILHNRTDGGDGISNPSHDTRKKLAQAKRNESPETRLKRSIAAKNRPRTQCSEETKRKISDANTGKKRSDSAKKKMALAKLNKPLSEEHKAKISNTLKGKPKPPFSAQHRERLSEANRRRAANRANINKEN